MVDNKVGGRKHVDAIVIGAGPAGLCGAIAIAESIGDGTKVLVVDEGIEPGGQLPKQTHKFFGHEGFYASVRGFEIGKRLVDKAKELGINFLMQTTLAGIYEDSIVAYDRNSNNLSEYTADYILIATGASERFLLFKNNTLPGVYGAGAVQTLMNQYKVMPGKSFLIIGAGNIGLIVAYQLLQAGAKVKAIVEATSKIGGYMVHANKIMRLGVPILLNHTIISALGEDRVEGAIIAQVDGKFKPIPGTEKEITVDTICLAVGLQPSVELVAQTGGEIRYISELGGYVPVRDENMKTTVDNVYVAGDLSGIEEASTAMIEGYIAGYNIAQKITGKDLSEKITDMKNELVEFRKGPFAAKVREGLKKMGISFPSGGYREEIQQIPSSPSKLKAVIECPQAIPCNPCETSCPTGAINTGGNINGVPQVDYEKCTGCGICVTKCPGLAIFLMQQREEHSIVGIPYEFLPIPEKGSSVKLLDKNGKYVADGQIDRVMINRKEKTHIVFLKVPKGMEGVVRHFEMSTASEESQAYICRCEEVSRNDVEKLIDAGITDYEEIRRVLRIGMGPCGGKTCRSVVLQIISEKTGVPISESRLGAFRPPVIPLPIDAIVRYAKGVDTDE